MTRLYFLTRSTMQRGYYISLIRSAAIIAVALLLIVLVAGPAKAQQEGASGLQIVPPRSEIETTPGEIKDFTVLVKNVTSGSITVKAVLNDFEADNISGTPRIIVDVTKRTPYTLEKMLKGLEDFELGPGESKEVKLIVDPPTSSPPGAYFGAVRFSAIPINQANNDEGQRQVSLTASVAHLVLVQLSGDITEKIQVESVRAYRGEKASSFFITKPDRMGVAIKNLGNGFAKPFGKVNISNMFGSPVYPYEMNVTNPRGVVLPDSSRTFFDELKNISTPGRYSVTASLAQGDGGEVVNYSASFWYMPLWVIIALIVLIAVIGIVAYLIHRRRKNRRLSLRK